MDTAASGFSSRYTQTITRTETITSQVSSLRPPATTIGVSNTAQVVDDLRPSGTGDFTLSGWFRYVSGATRNIIEWRSFTPRRGIQLNVRQSDGRVRFRLDGDSVQGETSAFTSTHPAADTWHHVAAVRRAGLVSLYIGGALVRAGSVNPGDITPDDDAAFTLGSAGVTMDDWCYWTRALTATEIAGLYAARNGLSAFDVAALLDASIYRAIVPLDPPDSAPAVGSRDLPWGGSVRLADPRTVPRFGLRAAATPYSQAAWLRIHTFPSEDWDIRLPTNDAGIDGHAGADPVVARDRDVDLSRDTGTYLVERATRGFWNVNLTTPASSTRIGTLPAGMSNVNAMAQHDDGNLYACSGSGLWIIDVENLANSRLVGRIGPAPPNDFRIEAMASHRGDLWGMTHQQVLVQIDTADPTQSGAQGTTTRRTELGTRGMYSTGDDLYLVESLTTGSPVTRINTDTPSQSVTVGSLPAAVQGPGGATFEDGRLLVTRTNGQIFSVDPTTFAATELGTLTGLPAVPLAFALAHYADPNIEASGLSIAADSGTITDLTLHRDGSAVLDFTGTLTLADRDLVLVRATADRVLSSTFELDMSAASTDTAQELSWAAGTIDGATLHAQVAAEPDGWSIIVLDPSVRYFDEANLTWKPPSSEPQPIYVLEGEQARPAIRIDMLPSDTGAAVNLITGPVHVSDETPLRYRHRGAAVNRSDFYAGDRKGILVVDYDPEESMPGPPQQVILDSGALVDVGEIVVSQEGGGRVELLLDDVDARLDFTPAVVIQCGSVIVGTTAAQVPGALNTYRAPAAGAYDALIPQIDRGQELVAVVVNAGAMGIDTTTWDWMAGMGVRVRAQVRGPATAPEDAAVEVVWPHDGAWHLFAWSFDERTLTASVDGAGEVTASTQSAADLWAVTPPPIGASEAVKGRQLDLTPGAQATVGTVAVRLYVSAGEHAYVGSDGSTFFIHQLGVSLAASGSPANHQLVLVPSTSSGAVLTNAPDATMDGLTVLLRVWARRQLHAVRGGAGR